MVNVLEETGSSQESIWCLLRALSLLLWLLEEICWHGKETVRGWESHGGNFNIFMVTLVTNKTIVFVIYYNLICIWIFQVFERGTKSISLSVELWLHYITFYTEEFGKLENGMEGIRG